MSDTTGPEAERCTQLQLRSLFPAAFEALRPFFDAANRWEGQSHGHLAPVCQRQTSRPVLNPQELHHV